MIVAYKTLAGSGGERPILDVLIGTAALRVQALVDSGATRTLFHQTVAEAAGVDLSEAEERELLLGPGRPPVPARFETVLLDAGGLQWEAEVGFCEDAPQDWGLLGGAGFFRFFTVTFRYYDSEFEIEPVAS
ncbi:MAG: retropepsin-like domain-containing protein [Actinomycetota bacterium]|nr:retropepsin-like domain-containing protein [Actinomycetota bacterium]